MRLAVVGGIARVFRGRTAEATFHGLPIAAPYLSNIFPVEGLLAITWSLAAEEQFYLVAPDLERRAPRQMPMLIAAAWLVVTIPALGGFPSLGLPSFFREATFGPILLGVGLAHLLNGERGFRLTQIRKLIQHQIERVLHSIEIVEQPSPIAQRLTSQKRIAPGIAQTMTQGSNVGRARAQIACIKNVRTLRIWSEETL